MALHTAVTSLWKRNTQLSTAARPAGPVAVWVHSAPASKSAAPAQFHTWGTSHSATRYWPRPRDRQAGLQFKPAWLFLQSCLQTYIFISDLSSYLTELLQIHAWCTHCLGTCNGQCASMAQRLTEQPTRAALWQLQCYARTQITYLDPVYLPLGQQISLGFFYYFVFF